MRLRGGTASLLYHYYRHRLSTVQIANPGGVLQWTAAERVGSTIPVELFLGRFCQTPTRPTVCPLGPRMAFAGLRMMKVVVRRLIVYSWGGIDISRSPTPHLPDPPGNFPEVFLGFRRSID